MMDIEQARFNMVEQQIRTWEVLDQSVLDLLFAVKREDFVPPAYRALAFVDMEIPLGDEAPGQLMMAPKLEARILQELAPSRNERVLEVGTGSGYLTALLAKRAAHVASIEYFAPMAASAATKLSTAGIHNAEIAVGDAATNLDALLKSAIKFDVIAITASLPIMPSTFLNHLAVGGRMFAIVGDAPAMKAILFTKTGENTSSAQELFETVVAPLINAAEPSRFTF